MYKQTIVIRTDLKMGRGKIAAQASHASLTAYKKVSGAYPDIARAWEMEGQMKVVLKVEGERELLELFQRAKDAGIPAALIRDAGHTQLEPGTITCIAAGPSDEKGLDRVFGHLKLL